MTHVNVYVRWAVGATGKQEESYAALLILHPLPDGFHLLVRYVGLHEGAVRAYDDAALAQPPQRLRH